MAGSLGSAGALAYGCFQMYREISIARARRIHLAVGALEELAAIVSGLISGEDVY